MTRAPKRPRGRPRLPPEQRGEDAAVACERADMDPCDCIKYAGPSATPPALVHAETAYGQTTRLSFAIKCF